MTGLELIVALMVLVGIVGTIVPILPGIVLVWGAMVVWVFVGEGGDAMRWAVLGLATVLTVAALVLSAVVPGRRAASLGAPRSLTWIVAAGTVVGFFVIPVVGAFVGGPVAAYVTELARLRDPAAAWRSAVEALKGLGIAVAIQLSAAVVIAATWAVVILVR